MNRNNDISSSRIIYRVNAVPSRLTVLALFRFYEIGHSRSMRLNVLDRCRSRNSSTLRETIQRFRLDAVTVSLSLSLFLLAELIDVI